MSGRHPSTQHFVRCFGWQHLPSLLQAISRPCAELADQMIDALPDGPELTAGLRKLLEAKDCFVRAALDQPATTPAERAPAVGELVTYRLSAYDAEQINRRYADAARHMADHQDRSDGSQLHVGNTVAAGEVYPMVIVRVWGETAGASVNGQVLLDGADTFWATSRAEGDEDGTWFRPLRVG